MDVEKYILSKAPGNLYWKDKNGVYLGCNIEFAHLLGLNSPLDIVGKSDADFLEKHYSEKKTQEILKVDKYIVEKNKEKTLEEIAIDQFGREAHYLTKKMPLKNGCGEVIGLIGMSLDITKFKKIKEGLEKEKAKSKKLKAVKSEFLANMCHDFRTPFSGILSVSEILENIEEDAEKKEYLGYMIQSSKALLNSFNEIVDFLATKESAIPILDIEFNLDNALQYIEDIFLLSAKSKNLSLKIIKMPNIPTLLLGDSYRTKKILEQLVSNAIRFTATGSVTLKAFIEKKIGTQEIIVGYLVEDTGVGIEEQSLTEIFEPFKRLTSSYQGIYEGKGIGLATVKQYMHELGGKIDVLSKPGKGSSFTVHIPYRVNIRDILKKENVCKKDHDGVLN